MTLIYETRNYKGKIKYDFLKIEFPAYFWKHQRPIRYSFFSDILLIKNEIMDSLLLISVSKI